MATIVIDMSHVRAAAACFPSDIILLPPTVLLCRVAIALADACLAIPTTAPSAHTEFGAHNTHTQC